MSDSGRQNRPGSTGSGKEIPVQDDRIAPGALVQPDAMQPIRDPMAYVRADRQSAAKQVNRSLKAWRAASGKAAGRAEIPSASSALASDVRQRLEPQLGADLSGVKVSTSGESARAAEQLGAKAFTVGQDVHFGASQYAPGTREGDHLIAHELAHTVQGARSGVQRKEEDGADIEGDGEGKGPAVSQPGEPAEVEADAVADRASDNLHGGEKAAASPATAAAPTIAAKLVDGPILRMPKVDADHDEDAKGAGGGGKGRRKPGSLGQAKGTDALRQENKVVRDVVVELKLDKDQAQKLHQAISGQGLDYHGIKALAQSMFPKGGKAK